MVCAPTRHVFINLYPLVESTREQPRSIQAQMFRLRYPSAHARWCETYWIQTSSQFSRSTHTGNTRMVRRDLRNRPSKFVAVVMQALGV